VAVIAFAGSKALPGLNKEQRAEMILSSEGSFAMIPADGLGDQLMFFSTIQTHERTRNEWHELNEAKQDLMDLLQDQFSTEKWPVTVREPVTDTPVDTFFCWLQVLASWDTSCRVQGARFYTLPKPEHFVSPLGRIVLAGDSAHAIPPSAGL
jgi:2-polyprenyl-6-methoxyphenol hydroxylase-like FAD-dependent oxidoreductase